MVYVQYSVEHAYELSFVVVTALGQYTLRVLRVPRCIVRIAITDDPRNISYYFALVTPICKSWL